MAGKNDKLSSAKKAKNDEFYTQWADIEKEIMSYYDYNPGVFRDKTVLLPCDDPEWSNFTKFFAQNFERFGLRKLISTSFAFNSKRLDGYYAPSLFEQDSPEFDAEISPVRGKLFVVDRDITGDGKINIADVHWTYLKGDGDFRSEEVRRLRDEADIIITNPPFSLFREFLAWILGNDRLTTKNTKDTKQFAIIGNMNAITYKEVFPLLKGNRLWLGVTGFVSDMVFGVPKGATVASADRAKAARLGYVGDYTRLGNSCWFTNIEHGRRHESLILMTMKDNIKHSRHKEVRGKEYQRYDNYDAIEVPFTDAIPSDYDGVMGVPISFMDKYCPEQFEILGMCENEDLYGLKTNVYLSEECKAAYQKKFGKLGTYDLNASGVVYREGLLEKVYQRILIRFKRTHSAQSAPSAESAGE